MRDNMKSCSPACMPLPFKDVKEAFCGNNDEEGGKGQGGKGKGDEGKDDNGTDNEDNDECVECFIDAGC